MLGGAWIANTLDVRQYMEIDAGGPMHIVGIITQGRGTSAYAHQYVTEFRVEHRLGDALGSGVEFPGTFTMTENSKKEHVFAQPVYARYIRIIVLAWNDHICMRAALVVKSCSTCLANAVSVQGSTSVGACDCPAGAYKSVSAVSARALALVPGSAQLATLSSRDMRLYAATAVFVSTGGPPPNTRSIVTFDRTWSQYLDGGPHTFNGGPHTFNGGPHTFNIATNGGFTAVAVVKFTGTPGAFERIIDFGKGRDNDNILLTRLDMEPTLGFAIRNGNSDCAVWVPRGAFVQKSWLTVVAIYQSSTRRMELRVGSSTASVQCPMARLDRQVYNTLVGTSNWAESANSQASIAGLYAVDAFLSETEILKISNSMYMGEDTLQSCQTCPNNAVSAQGSTDASACVCRAGFHKTTVTRQVNDRAVTLVPGRGAGRGELAALTTRNTDLVNTKTKVDGWRLVRFLPPKSAGWYSGNDHLEGTLLRGTAYDYNMEWSIPFGELDEFCFSTLNFLHWLHCTKDAAIGQIYDSVARPIQRSSTSEVPYTSTWFNRGTVSSADPLISISSFVSTPGIQYPSTDMLYAEDGRNTNLNLLPVDGGMSLPLSCRKLVSV